MDPFMVRMLERNKEKLQQLPDKVAENARLRDKQLLEAYYSGLQQRTDLRAKPGAWNVQPALKASQADNLGWRKTNERLGKENKSPARDIRKLNLSVFPTRQDELYPRRPPRSVYNSPLLMDGPQIFEKRYKSKPNLKWSPQRAPYPSDVMDGNQRPSSDADALRKAKSAGTINPILAGANAKPFKSLYPSLPKIDTSYDLDRLASKLLTASSCKTERQDEKMDVTEEEKYEDVPPSPSLTGKVCVKKIIEKFNQSPASSAAKLSPAKAAPRADKRSRSPLAASTMKSPVRVVPRLYVLTEPLRPVLREIGEHASPNHGKALDVEGELDHPRLSDIQEENKLNVTGYNVDNFLKDALGSELFFQSISSINSSAMEAELASTFDSADIQDSSIIHEQNGFLSMKFDDEISVEPVTPMELAVETPMNDSKSSREKHLTIEASVQRSLVAQTSKALSFCRSAKQFRESKELVEGERILLIANLRYHAALEEIKKCAEPISNTSVSRGAITISNITVPLKWDIFPKLDQSLCPQWFVCVLIFGETVQATEVVRLAENEPALRFRSSMQLLNLTSDFRARLQLYAFRSPKFSHKSKNRLIQACKMLRRPTRNCLGPAGSKEELMYLRNPAFTMIGCTEVTVQLLNQTQPVSCSLEQVPMVSLIKGTISFRLTARLLTTRKLAGFVNVLRPAGEGHAWQRWWCHLDGRFVRCWNYPSDQDVKNPEYILDLGECFPDRVVQAPRVLCSRARTLMLETPRGRKPHDLDCTLLACSTDSTIVRHFLSYDTPADMNEWSSALNECLRALYLWSIPAEDKIAIEV